MILNLQELFRHFVWQPIAGLGDELKNKMNKMTRIHKTDDTVEYAVPRGNRQFRPLRCLRGRRGRLS